MLTPDQARERLRRAGKTVGEVARELKVDHSIVRKVLGGQLKGDYGEAHKVAVALGLKDGVIVPEGTPIGEAMKMAGGAR